MQKSNHPYKSTLVAFLERTAFGVVPIGIGLGSTTSGFAHQDSKSLILGAALCLTGLYSYLAQGRRIDQNKKIHYLNETIEDLDTENQRLENMLKAYNIDPKKEVPLKVLDIEVEE